MDIGQAVSSMYGIVYILQSKTNSRYYIGSTNNLDRRLEEHNKGFAKYTSFTRPFNLVFSQKFDNLVIARKMESKLKRMKSRIILEKIIKDGFIKVSV